MDHLLPRLVQPELLDELPQTDPRAIRSRKDLQRLNWWMGNAAKAARALRSQFPQPGPRKLMELGAGNGTFFLHIAELLGPDWRGSQALLLDRQDLVSDATRRSLEKLGWQVEILHSDVFEALQRAPQDCDIILANLFLHHFTNSQLKELLRLSSERTCVFVAIEPARSVQSLFFSCLLWLIGCNRVTRHDAVVSVQAGFREKELTSLWPKGPGWICREGRSGQFSHIFTARKTQSPGITSENC